MTISRNTSFWFMSFHVCAMSFLTLLPFTVEARQLSKMNFSPPDLIEELVLPKIAKPSRLASTSASPQLAHSTLLQPIDRQPTVNAGQIYFDQTRRSISSDNSHLLNHIMSTLKRKNWILHIEGICDERGTRAYNLAQAHQRATHVSNYLMNLGMTEWQLSSTGLTEIGHLADDSQLQYTFQFLSVEQTRQGCVARLQLEAGSEWPQALRLIQHKPFLQRIHLSRMEDIN